MIAWLGQHWAALALVLRRLFGAPLGSLLTVAVIGVTLSLPAGLYLLLDNLGRFTGDQRADPQISLFVARDAGEADIERLRRRLQEHPDIAEVRHIPRDAALAELQETAGLGDIIASLDRNPLPDAFVVRAGHRDPARLEKLRDELAAERKIDVAQLDSVWARRLHALLATGRQAALILAGLLGIGLLAVTANTIRLQILTQRDEIELSRLIGATDRFIRRPFLYYGALLGAAGGLAALACVAAGFALLDARLEELATLYGSAFRLSAPPAAFIGGLLGGAALLGWLAAYAAVTRYLRKF